MEEISKVKENINNYLETREITIFSIDLKNYIGRRVTVCGVIVDKKVYKHYNVALVFVKDITGTVRLRMTCDFFDRNRDFFHKKKRISCSGVVVSDTNKNNEIVYTLIDVDNIEVLFSFEDGQENTISDNESLLLLSRLINVSSEFLSNNDFHQIETRLISTYAAEDGLSPLKVVYDGFGEPAVLTTSPTPQLMNFLLTAYLERVFTISTSFSQTFRSPGMGSEERVIVAKATKLGDRSLKTVILAATKYVLQQSGLQGDELEVKDIDGEWDEPWYPNGDLSSNFFCIQYRVNIPINHNNLHTIVKEIYHIKDRNGILLAEGAIESLANDDSVNFFTMILYPNQFLSTMHKKSLRTIRNLWNIGNRGKNNV